MPLFVVRLARAIPLVIALLVIAGIVYVLAAWRTNPNRAKLILIRSFLVLCSVLLVFFLLTALYAFIDSNPVAVEIALTFALSGALGVIATLIARSVFLRHHPQYAQKAVRTTYVDTPLRMRFIQWLAGL